MSPGPPITNRRELHDFLDSYTYSRRTEIDKRQLGKDVGLLKSYILETTNHNGTPDISHSLTSDSLRVDSDEGNLVRLSYSNGLFGYAEPLTSRHFAIHSYVQNDSADQTVQRAIRDSSDLDSLWLAGETFYQVLDQLIRPSAPHRSVNIKFEFNYKFSAIGYDHEADQLTAEELAADQLATDESTLDDVVDDVVADEEVNEDRWAVSLIEKAGRLASNLPQYQEINRHWEAIKMLRIPSQRQGGFDLWNWGKMTHRASTFREGNGYLRYIASVYEQATRAIEETVWLDAEPTRIRDTTQFRLKGVPVVFRFRNTLPPSIFQDFITTTFAAGQGPFRLWGNPIYMGPGKVHVYGMDLHLWQQLYMELTTDYFLFLLPQGTCGNTVHRLMTNIQRYVDPGVSASVGGTNYEDFIVNAMRTTVITDD